MYKPCLFFLVLFLRPVASRPVAQMVSIPDWSRDLFRNRDVICRHVILHKLLAFLTFLTDHVTVAQSWRHDHVTESFVLKTIDHVTVAQSWCHDHVTESFVLKTIDHVTVAQSWRHGHVTESFDLKTIDHCLRTIAYCFQNNGSEMKKLMSEKAADGVAWQQLVNWRR